MSASSSFGPRGGPPHQGRARPGRTPRLHGHPLYRHPGGQRHRRLQADDPRFLRRLALFSFYCLFVPDSLQHRSPPGKRGETRLLCFRSATIFQRFLGGREQMRPPSRSLRHQLSLCIQQQVQSARNARPKHIQFGAHMQGQAVPEGAGRPSLVATGKRMQHRLNSYTRRLDSYTYRLESDTYRLGFGILQHRGTWTPGMRQRAFRGNSLALLIQKLARGAIQMNIPMRQPMLIRFNGICCCRPAKFFSNRCA